MPQGEQVLHKANNERDVYKRQVYDEKSGNVSGNSCAMGARYAAAEAVDPKRVVTSTVRINSSTAVMLPVKTNFAIPKHMVMKAVELLNDIEAVSYTHLDVYKRQTLCFLRNM